MVQTDLEAALAESLPAGFGSTFIESSRLRRLSGVDTGNLGNTVAEYNDFKLTESDVILSEAQKILTSFTTPERTIELPGLALALQANLVASWAAEYKRDNDTPSGTITNPARAEVDDIVFAPLSPEVFKEITGDDTLSPNFKSTGLVAGDKLPVIGDKGHDTAQNTAGNPLSLDPEEQIFLTGDVIDLSQGQSVITAGEYPEIDGRDFGRTDVIAQSRLSGAHILTMQGTFATDSVEKHVKVYDDGDAELVPVGFYLGPGRNRPDLV